MDRLNRPPLSTQSDVLLLQLLFLKGGGGEALGWKWSDKDGGGRELGLKQCNLRILWSETLEKAAVEDRKKRGDLVIFDGPKGGNG